MVTAGRPLLLQTLGDFVHIVDLIDGHPLVGQMQHTVVQVCVSVPLRPHYLLNPLVAPARPAVRGKHHLGLLAKFVKRYIDLFGPFQGIAHQRPAQGVNVVDRGHDVLSSPKSLELRKVGIHFRRRFCAGRVLENHANPIDGQLLEILFDDNRFSTCIFSKSVLPSSRQTSLFR